ncbi:MAG: R3H domain-containing nucleic acid-binding protein [Jatrophihabitantaceae bacterium]
MSDTEVVTEPDGVDSADSVADGNENASADGDEGTDGLLVQEGDIAADYLERLLDIVDFDGDIDLDVENDRAVVAIVGNGLNALIGNHGETLDALQELTRLAVAQKTGGRSRLMLDVSGHRQARRTELTELATDTATRVKESGESARLAPMNPFERKVVHDAVSAIVGVRSESEGEEPNRRVVVLADS